MLFAKSVSTPPSACRSTVSTAKTFFTRPASSALIGTLFGLCLSIGDLTQFCCALVSGSTLKMDTFTRIEGAFYCKRHAKDHMSVSHSNAPGLVTGDDGASDGNASDKASSSKFGGTGISNSFLMFHI